MFKIIAITILFLQLSVLIGCEKPNPEPEKLDQVYEELEKQAAAVGADIAKFQTQLDEHLVTLKKAEPQTGQIKYAQKHVYETSALIDRLKQKKRYWEIRAKSRKERDRIEYLKAFYAKKPWPPPAELAKYKESLKNENANLHWSYERRMNELGIPMPKKKIAGEGEAEKPAEGEKKGH